VAIINKNKGTGMEQKSKIKKIAELIATLEKYTAASGCYDFDMHYRRHHDGFHKSGQINFSKNEIQPLIDARIEKIKEELKELGVEE